MTPAEFKIEDYVTRCDDDKTRFSKEPLSAVVGSARPYIMKYLGGCSVTISGERILTMFVGVVAPTQT